MSKFRRRHNIKSLVRSAILLILFAFLVVLTIFFRPKLPLQSLVDFASNDQPAKPTLTTIIISASTGTKKADIFQATATTASEAFSSALERTLASPDYKEYIYFRLDAAYGAAAANANSIINAFPAFTDYSYFSSADQKPMKLSTNPPTLSASDIRDLIHKNALYLAKGIAADGRFFSGRSIIADEELVGYSMNAHAAATSALLKAYSLSHDDQLLQRVEPALAFLDNFVVISDADPTLAYIENAEAEAIDLGATALAATAFIDYRDITGDTKYDNLVKHLLNGAESMYLGTDCNLYGHELDLDLTPRENYIDRLYNVQTTYALLRAYDAFKTPAYLEQAERNLDYMQERAYTADYPYWFPLTVKLFQKLSPDSEKYPDNPDPSPRPPETIYSQFVEPWLAMFAPNPSAALYSFVGSAADYRSTLADNQAALFELIDYLDTN